MLASFLPMMLLFVAVSLLQLFAKLVLGLALRVDAMLLGNLLQMLQTFGTMLSLERFPLLLVRFLGNEKLFLQLICGLSFCRDAEVDGHFLQSFQRL